jgi:hypothetical protein
MVGHNLLGNERIKSSSSSLMVSNGKLVTGKRSMEVGDTFSSAFALLPARREEVAEREVKRIFGSVRAIVERLMCLLTLMGTTLVLHGEEYASFMVLPFVYMLYFVL